MKIVINALSARNGGGQTYLRQLLSRLPDVSDLEILIFASDSLALPSHPQIKRLPTNFPTESPLPRTFWEKFILPGLLRKLAPDIYFCPGGVVASKAPKGCRVVTMFRNMVPFDAMVKKDMPFGFQKIRVWLLRGAMLRSMANADLVIFISEYARSVIEAEIQVKKALTIPHGISPHFRQFDPQANLEGIVPAKPFLLYVSRFESYKHHAEVVMAYLALPEAMQKTYDMVLVGENDNPFGERVRQLIAEKGAGDRVHMVGGVKYETLPNVYRKSTLTVFASACENCPNILLEALAAGRPIICSSRMPMPEFGGDAVAYFDPANVQEARNAMAGMLGDAERLGDFGMRAQAQGRKFDWDVTARETWAAILAL